MRKRAKPKGLRIMIWTITLFLLLFIFTPYLLPISSTVALAEPFPFDNSELADVNGVSFHYRVYRPNSDTILGKLLLVHGLAGSTFSYDVSAPLVSKEGYYVVSVDLPGFGYSDRNPAYDHSQAKRASDLWLLLRAIDQNLPDNVGAMPWHLAGHSMGGGTVAAMTMQVPSRVQSLILVDAALFDAPSGAGFLTFPPLGRWMMTALEYFLITESRIKSLLTSAYGREPTRAEIEGYLRPLRLPGTARSLVNFARTAKSEDPAGLKWLEIPICAIWGECDTWVPQEELDRVVSIRPDIQVQLIEGAAHCPMETHPIVFSTTVLEWLSDHPNAT